MGRFQPGGRCHWDRLAFLSWLGRCHGGSLVGALSVFGLDPSVALAFALTAHLIHYFTTGVIGAYALVKDGESLTGLYRRVRERTTDDRR